MQYLLLAVNILGAIVYVWMASRGWVTSQQIALHSVTGEPFIWGLSVLPIVAVFLPTNIIWGGIILIRRQWQKGKMWLLAALIWLVAIVVDFAHH